jgi:hypothetical protein
MAGSTGLYEISFKMGKNDTNNIQHFSIIRVPLEKHASFAICKLNLSPTQIKAIQTACGQNKYIEAVVEIYQVDRETKKRQSPISQKKYLILSAKPDSGENIDVRQAKQSAILVLAHPVLFEMNSRNQYNMKHNNMTCLDAIKQYESKIPEYYGDVFHINRIGENTKKNDFRYEEQLIKAPNDLYVPRLLTGMYKCYHSYNLFFFDCFNLSKTAKKEITIHHLNFYDPKDFKKIDIHKSDDIIKFSIPGTETPFTDVNREYNFTTDPNITYITSNNQYIHEKTKEGQSKQYDSKDRGTQKLAGDREYTITQTGSAKYKKVNRGTQTIQVEVPETDIKNAKERITCIKETKIESIKQFVFQMCLPDFPNFGEIYNLELDNRSEYLYTPIAICNNFVRESGTDPWMKHYSEANFVKYQSKTTQA